MESYTLTLGSYLISVYGGSIYLFSKTLYSFKHYKPKILNKIPPYSSHLNLLFTLKINIQTPEIYKINQIKQYLMESNTKNFRQIESLQLSECITALELTEEYLAAGCLDDNIYLWAAEFTNFQKQPLLAYSGNSMGIVDIKFNKINTNLAISCLDSSIKIYDIDTKEINNIECQVMENWKVQFLGNNIVTAGDSGRVAFFDLISKEKVKKLDSGEIFLTALAKSNESPYQFLATGNNNGDVSIFNLSKKDKLSNLKTHYKMVRSLSFTEDSTKLLSSSDDYSIKMIDINSETVTNTFEGHKQAVTRVVAHPTDNKLAFSCSFDKTVKCWDLRMNNCVGTAVTGSALWSCAVWGSNVVAGGENGVLTIYSIQ